MRRGFVIVLLTVGCVMLGARIFAQESPVPAPSPAPTQEPSAPAPAAPPQGGRGQTGGEPRPYDQVVTKDAKSDDGVFKIHRIRERVLYEIPQNELDKEFLFVTQIAKTTLGAGYGGQALSNRVVRWNRMNNRVFL